MGARRRATFWSARRQRQSRSAGTLRLPLKCSTTVQCSPSSATRLPLAPQAQPSRRECGGMPPPTADGQAAPTDTGAAPPAASCYHRRGLSPPRPSSSACPSGGATCDLCLHGMPVGSGVAFRTRGSAGGRVCVCRVWCVSPITKKTVTATHYGQRSSSSEAASSTWSGAPCVAVICLFLTSGLRWSRRSSPASSLSFYCLLF